MRGKRERQWFLILLIGLIGIIPQLDAFPAKPIKTPVQDSGTPNEVLETEGDNQASPTEKKSLTCMIYDYNFFTYLVKARAILPKIKTTLENFDITNFIDDDFKEYPKRFAFAEEVKTDFRTVFSQCYRIKGELFTITNTEDLEFLKTLTKEDIWQSGIKISNAKAIIHPGNIHNIELAVDGNNITNIEIPDTENPEKCKVFSSKKLAYEEVDCSSEQTMVCEIKKTQNLLNIQYLNKCKAELLTAISSVIDIGAPKRAKIFFEMRKIKTDDTLCSGVPFNSLANVFGIEKLVNVFEEHKPGILEIAAMTSELLQTFRTLKTLVEAKPTGLFTLIKHLLFRDLNFELYSDSNRDRFCGCQTPISMQIKSRSPHENESNEIDSESKGNNNEDKEITFTDSDSSNGTNPTGPFEKLEDFFDFRFFELFSLILSVIAIVIISFNVWINASRKREKNKNNSLDGIEDHELESLDETRTINAISRRYSLPNLKKVTFGSFRKYPESISPESNRFELD